MKQFVVKHFLLVVLVLAVAFAFAMRATVFQAPHPPKGAQTDKQENAPSEGWGTYWFGDKAELNSYRLEQAYNGTLSPGKAVLIFETEDFRTDKQVKADSGTGRDRSVPVLKTTMSKKFVTGMSDYSLYTSVFTPINNPSFPNTLKVSTSVQNWQGHSYQQINYGNNGYQVSGQSYLENEVDEHYTVAKVLPEDELWNRIRMNPDRLPAGDVQLIPGTMTARLRHKPLQPLAAKLKLDTYEGILFPGKFLKAYTIQYPTDDRTLVIIFESQFPHKIVGWEETYDSKDNLLTSRAVLTRTIQTDYQNHSSPADSALRKALFSNL